MALKTIETFLKSYYISKLKYLFDSLKMAVLKLRVDTNFI